MDVEQVDVIGAQPLQRLEPLALFSSGTRTGIEIEDDGGEAGLEQQL